MPIAVTCPECASGYRVPDTAAGKAIKCKKCGARVPIAAEKNGTPTARNGNHGAPKKKGAAAVKILVIVGGILAVTCFLCLGVSGLGTWWAYSKTTSVVNDAFKDLPKDAIIVKDGKDGKDALKDAFKDAFKDGFKDLSKGFK